MNAQFLTFGISSSGFLIDFISGPVSAGFTSAAAITIATTQVKDILGITNFKGSAFMQVWKEVFQRIGESSLYDSLLGIACIILIFILKVSFVITFFNFHFLYLVDIG